ncbi:hypothetical protein EVAR_44755_1 [Eumeta japonica]|uniref:Uncharacterized protein n=1 Tax=Eumeta variegata TaxID=151549 RepID=A0A4C1XJY2_EUMVA|nr:hypothetical protein EVAR_44755_1 [Eumeta japonica]
MGLVQEVTNCKEWTQPWISTNEKKLAKSMLDRAHYRNPKPLLQRNALQMRKIDILECPSCPRKAEDAKHMFFVCPRFNSQPDGLETILNQRIQPETLVEAMLSTKAAWNATNTFATEVLTDLRSIEKRKARDSN